MDELTQDYIQALEDEVACIDQAIELMFDRRRELFETRERVLAGHNPDNKRADNP
jgi:hypothetical protein